MPARKTTNKTKQKATLNTTTMIVFGQRVKWRMICPPGIENGFVKMEPLCFPGILKMVNKQESGRLMIKKERFIK